jgi:hypothetical protein
MRATFKLIACVWMAGASSGAFAMDALIRDLKARLERTDADVVNRYLDDHFEKTIPRLRDLVVRCDPDALRLTVRLLDSTNASATQGNAAMLELAMGTCPERVLPLVPVMRVKALCAVEAFADSQQGAVAPEALLTEIERRVRHLRARAVIAASENGRACLEGYEVLRRELSDAH